jgi:hypothetical protein
MSSMILATLLALLQSQPVSRTLPFPTTQPFRLPVRSAPRARRHLELAVGPTVFYSADMAHHAGPNLAGGGVEATAYFDRWRIMGLWIAGEIGAASLHVTDSNLSGMDMGYGCVAAGPHLYRGSFRFLIGGRYCHLWSIQDVPDLAAVLRGIKSGEEIEGLVALEYTAAHFLALEIQIALGADGLLREEGVRTSRDWLPAVTVTAAILFTHDLL